MSASFRAKMRSLQIQISTYYRYNLYNIAYIKIGALRVPKIYLNSLNYYLLLKCVQNICNKPNFSLKTLNGLSRFFDKIDDK